MKRLILFLFLAIPLPASVANLYISQSGAGGTTGNDCANAKAASFFNTSGNWGSLNTIGPGTTVHLCGTFTGSSGGNMLTVQGSGTSGNVITLLFETGAQMNAPYWGDNPFSGTSGAIICASKDYITIDGGTNGKIQNTANGTSLANQHFSTGIGTSSCSHLTIKNVSVLNVYVRTLRNDTNGPGTAGISVQGGDFWTIQNNTVTWASENFLLGYTALTSADVSGNIADYGCHLLRIGDITAGSTASGINWYNNTLGPNQTIWQIDQNIMDNCHGDGFLIGAFQTGSTMSNSNFYNNLVTSDMCSSGGNPNCTAPFFMTGEFSGINIFNNIIAFVSGGTGESILRLAATTTMANFSIYNNVLVGIGGSGLGFKFDAGSGWIAKNNIFYNNGANYQDNIGVNFAQFSSMDYGDYNNFAVRFSNGSPNYATFANFKSGTGFESHGITGAPLLTATYALGTGSAAICTGTNLFNTIAALNFDKAGNARANNSTITCSNGSNSWDMGAFVYGSSPPPPPTINSAPSPQMFVSMPSAPTNLVAVIK